MARKLLPLVLVAAAAGLGCAHSSSPGAAPAVLRDALFEGDRRLSGRIVLAGEAVVPKGSTLRLAPGTTIAFVPEDLDGDGIGDARLRVDGRLLAEGTPAAPVLFTSAGNRSGERRPGDWETILVNFSEGNRLTYTLVEYAAYALHAHFTEAAVTDSIIRRNLEGCRSGNSRLLFERCLVRENVSKGLNFHASANRVTASEITANGNGLFLFEKDDGSLIAGNNIHGNERYDFRLDDFFTGDMRLGENWWGSPREEEVRRRIYDAQHDPGIGAVHFTPAPARYPLASPFEPPP
jgi:hypothetical protein